MKNKVLMLAVMSGLCSGAAFAQQDIEAELSHNLGTYKLVSGSSKCLPNLEIAVKERSGAGMESQKWFSISTFDEANFAYAMDVQELMDVLPSRRTGPGEFVFPSKAGSYGKEKITLSLSPGRARLEQKITHFVPVRISCEYAK